MLVDKILIQTVKIEQLFYCLVLAQNCLVLLVCKYCKNWFRYYLKCKRKSNKICLVLLVSARRMIQVMSGVTDPRVQQLQVTNFQRKEKTKIFLTWGARKWARLLVNCPPNFYPQKCVILLNTNKSTERLRYTCPHRPICLYAEALKHRQTHVPQRHAEWWGGWRCSRS